jgi:hypothetical protein
MNAKAARPPSVLAGEQPSPNGEALAELNPRAQHLDSSTREGHGSTRQTNFPPLEVNVGRA